jgi:diguanylate cyclase (GGDEF)-like protein/putative nucleotidyltransferase with HDIG domain
MCTLFAKKTWNTFRQLPRQNKALSALFALYVTAFSVVISLHAGTSAFRVTFSDSCQMISAILAAICCFVYGIREEKETKIRRLAWGSIGIACLSWAAGQGVWTYFECIKHAEIPNPGPPDIGFLAVYPFLIFGIITLFGSFRIKGRASLVLDSAIAASSVGFLSWYFLIQSLLRKAEGSSLARFVDLAYPLGDIACLFCAITLLNAVRYKKQFIRPMFALAAGTAIVTIADSFYAYYNSINAYHTGMWIDFCWTIGWPIIGCGALLSLWQRDAAIVYREDESAKLNRQIGQSVWYVLGPYVAVSASFILVAFYDYKVDHIISQFTLRSGLVLIFLVLIRQMFTLLDNRSLARQLNRFNETLELTVQHRTEELHALLALTKAVNDTLDVDRVLSSAAQHTRQAVRSESVILRVCDDHEFKGFPPIRYSEGLDNNPEILNYIATIPPGDKARLVPLPCDTATDHLENHYLEAPLRWRKNIIGTIGVTRTGSQFSYADYELLESIGLEVGAALENARRYASVLEEADRDALTGLYNHRALHQLLDKAFNSACKEGCSLAVIMMDMVNFKLFNDTYGHPSGVQILKTVALSLNSECLEHEILGRYGGDEFLIILPNCDSADALKKAERLRKRLTSEGFQLPGDERTVPIMLRFGVATFPDDGINPHELLTIADENLFAAKSTDSGIVGTSETQHARHALRTEGSFSVLDALVTAVDNKDRYTRLHSRDVTEYALWIADELGLSDESSRIVRVGGLLHDVGKIGAPEHILHKPGRLTEEEYEILKRHPELGAIIIGAMPGMEPILDIVRFHHERWDGAGYPLGLSGEAIPLLSRIVAIADAFSAMTTDRPYRKGLDFAIAIDQIQKGIGSQFDPELALIFIRTAKKRVSTDQQNPQKHAKAA